MYVCVYIDNVYIYIYIYLFIHTYIHTYIQKERERERERETETETEAEIEKVQRACRSNNATLCTHLLEVAHSTSAAGPTPASPASSEHGSGSDASSDGSPDGSPEVAPARPPSTAPVVRALGPPRLVGGSLDPERTGIYGRGIYDVSIVGNFDL